MTVTDTFGRTIRDLRISVTDRCNFRCSYCMPAGLYSGKYTFLPKGEILTFEEIARLTGILVNLGIRKIRLTGGEPLMREDVEGLVSQLGRIRGIDDIALTTNAYLLPNRAQALRDAGLHRISVSLDSLDDAVFKRMNGRKYSVKRVLDGIKSAEDAGFTPLKINAVIQRGVNDHTVVDLARHFRGTGHIVRFIEYMDVGNINGWNLAQVVPAAEILSRINEVFPVETVAAHYDGEVAERYVYRDGGGEVGIIASVTHPFCSSCTRLRLSTDGKLYTCLFASEGADMRRGLRGGASDGELAEIIGAVWHARSDRYSELRTGNTSLSGAPRKIEMYQMGG